MTFITEFDCTSIKNCNIFIVNAPWACKNNVIVITEFFDCTSIFTIWLWTSIDVPNTKTVKEREGNEGFRRPMNDFKDVLTLFFNAKLNAKSCSYKKPWYFWFTSICLLLNPYLEAAVLNLLFRRSTKSLFLIWQTTRHQESVQPSYRA